MKDPSTLSLKLSILLLCYCFTLDEWLKGVKVKNESHKSVSACLEWRLFKVLTINRGYFEQSYTMMTFLALGMWLTGSEELLLLFNDRRSCQTLWPQMTDCYSSDEVLQGARLELRQKNKIWQVGGDGQNARGHFSFLCGTKLILSDFLEDRVSDWNQNHIYIFCLSFFSLQTEIINVIY